MSEFESMFEGHGNAVLASNLWRLAGKLHGLGELFSMVQAEPPLSEVGCRGVSQMLLEVASDLDALREGLETVDETRSIEK